jgi:hypothetical protein
MYIILWLLEIEQKFRLIIHEVANLNVVQFNKDQIRLCESYFNSRKFVQSNNWQF